MAEMISRTDLRRLHGVMQSTSVHMFLDVVDWALSLQPAQTVTHVAGPFDITDLIAGTIHDPRADRADNDSDRQLPAFLQPDPAIQSALPKTTAISSPPAVADNADEPESIEQTPAEPPVAAGTGTETRLKVGEPWTEQEDAQLLRLIGTGKRIADAAEILRRPVPGTQFRLKKLRGQAKALAQQAAPTPAPAQKAGSEADQKPLTVIQRSVLQHLQRLSDDFMPSDDLHLAEQLAKGTPIEVIADDLGCDVKTVQARWKAFLFEHITSDKGVLTIQGQSDLLHVLRHRAAADA